MFYQMTALTKNLKVFYAIILAVVIAMMNDESAIAALRESPVVLTTDVANNTVGGEGDTSIVCMPRSIFESGMFGAAFCQFAVVRPVARTRAEFASITGGVSDLEQPIALGAFEYHVSMWLWSALSHKLSFGLCPRLAYL